MNNFTKFVLGMWAIGIIYEMIDEFRAKKMVQDYVHTPEFERILNHYKETTS